MVHPSARTRRYKSGRDRRRGKREQKDIAAIMTQGTRISAIYRPLSDSDVEKIHDSALDLLEQVGMATPTSQVRDIALTHGCRINDDGRLLFPRGLVDDILSQAARQFVVHGRDSIFDFEAKNGRVNFCIGGAAVSMLDVDTRRYRPSTLADLYDSARICDTLENVQCFARPVVATDVDDPFELDVNTVYASAAGTRKHIATSITKGDHVHRMSSLLDMLAPGSESFSQRPFCTVNATTTVSPMAFAEDSLDVVCAAVEIGMPIHCQTGHYQKGRQADATAPTALAGTLVQCCAENLASLTMINLLKPGHPVLIGNWTFGPGLRTGAFSGGGGEQALLGAASSQMSAFYGIPGGVGAGMSDSKLPDNQAGFEKVLTMALASLSGGGFVYESAGMLANLPGCSLESMIVDDDMLSSIRRVARGIAVNDETLSVSVIADAIAGPGHFPVSNETMFDPDSEYVSARHNERTNPDDWRDRDVLEIWDRAGRRAKHILLSHRPVYVDPGIDKEIRNQYNIRLSRSWSDAL